ncbi:HK97 family phage prohead protease [Limibaculum sp. FT325]|uniref:HK97 family phage prohead protease n=1 Tax=Thermohalobaculum sediminis TaxID=2939436 RepID=UPI0020C03583|nr:HK97 family phage prohead protease [Limibaculum sediminis]MCL5775591.1 HK97 family phage prohead protease [Limibaculum sediminis]
MRAAMRGATRPPERKFLSLTDLTAGAEAGEVTGYASVFGEVDQGGDRMMPGAFARSLERRAAAGRTVRFLWQHDPERVIGVWHELREDSRGLWVRGRILPEVAQGVEALALMRAGAIDGLSIGYRVVKAEPHRHTGGRNLIEIDLWEVSLVTFPMLPTARASLGGSASPGFVQALAAALTDGAGQPS